MSEAPLHPTIPPADRPRPQYAAARRSGYGSMGLGSAIALFFALLFMFAIAAGVARMVVRGDRSVQGEAPPAPPVQEDVVPAQPSPPADGNPAGQVSPEAVTP